VINAAVTAHQVHQNLARYFEKVHDFDPDVVVNIDGTNDNGVFYDLKMEGGYKPGDPYSYQKIDLIIFLT